MFNGQNFEFVKDRFGRPNSAISFSGGYFQIPESVYFKGDFTISVWIRTFSSNQKFIDIGNGDSSDNIVFLTSQVYIYIKNFESHTKDTKDPSLTVVGEWYHLVFTLNGTFGTLYMNGIKINQACDMYVPRNVNRTYNYVGNLWGELDELRFYKRSMLPSEVNYLFLEQIKDETYENYK